MLDLNNKKDSATIQELLRQGVNDDFWLLLIQAISASKETVRKQISDKNLRDLPAEQYKVENEILLEKEALLGWLENLPDTIIAWLSNPDQRKEQFDPYHGDDD